MSVTLSENEITVSLNNKDPLDYIAHNGNTSGINITLFDPQTYAFLLKIPVYLRLIPHPLKAGSIRCNTKSIPPGISPGTIENITDPSGGTGNYAYRWQKSTNNGSTWTTIAGATSLTYDCPPLTETTAFRRMVVSGVQRAYSNMVTVTVITNPSLPDLPPANENYVLTRTMQDDTGTSYSDKIDYFDGLGRLPKIGRASCRERV
mgnify:CR=1 FL=1